MAGANRSVVGSLSFVCGVFVLLMWLCVGADCSSSEASADQLDECYQVVLTPETATSSRPVCTCKKVPLCDSADSGDEDGDSATEKQEQVAVSSSPPSTNTVSPHQSPRSNEEATLSRRRTTRNSTEIRSLRSRRSLGSQSGSPGLDQLFPVKDICLLYAQRLSGCALPYELSVPNKLVSRRLEEEENPTAEERTVEELLALPLGEVLENPIPFAPAISSLIRTILTGEGEEAEQYGPGLLQLVAKLIESFAEEPDLDWEELLKLTQADA